jgi:hypothetical protein
MRLAKSILCGAAALGFAAGSALADESTSSGMEFDGQVAWNDSPDRPLTIGQSDTLALAPSDAGLETQSRG